jgi:hypothetical protein
MRKRAVGLALVIVVASASSCGTTGTVNEAKHLLGTLPTLVSLHQLVDNSQLSAQTSVVRAPGELQGTLTPHGVVDALGHDGFYASDLKQTHAGVGANVSYRVQYYPAATSVTDNYDVLAIKFPTAADGASFARRMAATLSSVGGATIPECGPCPFHYGILPAADQNVMEVPASPLGEASGPSFVAQILYAEGTYYLTAIEVTSPRIVTGPAGTSAANAVVPAVALAEFVDSTYRYCLKDNCP